MGELHEKSVFVFKVLSDFENLNLDKTRVCQSVCLSLASDSSETVEVIIIKLGTVTVSDM